MTSRRRNGQGRLLLNYENGFSQVPTPDRCVEIVKSTGSDYTNRHSSRPVHYTTNTPEYIGVYVGLVDASGKSQSRGFGIPDSNLQRRFHRNGMVRDIQSDGKDHFRTVQCRHRNASSVVADFMFEQSLRPEAVRENGTVIPAGVLVRKAAARWNATRKRSNSRKSSKRSNRSNTRNTTRSKRHGSK